MVGRLPLTANSSWGEPAWHASTVGTVGRAGVRPPGACAPSLPHACVRASCGTIGQGSECQRLLTVGQVVHCSEEVSKNCKDALHVDVCWKVISRSCVLWPSAMPISSGATSACSHALRMARPWGRHGGGGRPPLPPASSVGIAGRHTDPTQRPEPPAARPPPPRWGGGAAVELCGPGQARCKHRPWAHDTRAPVVGASTVQKRGKLAAAAAGG